MKRGVLVLLVLVLVPSLGAIWEEFRVDGVGYFDTDNLISITIHDGMDYQPLVADIDNNGHNEVVIFSGNYLKIFDNELNLIDEENVGQ